MPVALFLTKYNTIHPSDIETHPGKDIIYIDYSTVSHAMVGSGYRQINYHRYEIVSVWSPVWYNPFRFVDEIRDVNFRNDDYLKVALSVGETGNGYLRLNDNAVIADAFGAKIY